MSWSKKTLFGRYPKRCAQCTTELVCGDSAHVRGEVPSDGKQPATDASWGAIIIVCDAYCAAEYDRQRVGAA